MNRLLRRHALHFFIGLMLAAALYTCLIVWLPYRREHRAAAKIRAVGGRVAARYQGPNWLPPIIQQKLVFFERVHRISFLGQKTSPTAFREALSELPSFESLESLYLQSGFSDEAMEYLESLVHVRQLMLSNTTITDEGLVHLSNLAQLEWIDLSGTEISGAGLRHLKSSRLKSLWLEDTRVTDIGLESLEAMTQLEVLFLGHTQLTNAGLARIGTLSNLTELLIQGTRVNATGLAHLKGLKKLVHLDLGYTDIADSDVEHLVAFTTLKELHLIGTRVTDAGLVHLEGMTNLRVLDLKETRTTPDGRAKLQAALPNCDFTVNP